MKRSDKIVVIGIGNIGRQDDGLGWLFLDFLQKENLDITIEYRYQLQIEDANLISDYDIVVFVDATKEHIEKGFYYRSCLPSDEFSFSTHALKPETVVYLSTKLYNKKTQAYLLGIEGYTWELETKLSSKAQNNLDKAFKYFATWINDVLVTN